jgi:hypothetical protein
MQPYISYSDYMHPLPRTQGCVNYSTIDNHFPPKIILVHIKNSLFSKYKDLFPYWTEITIEGFGHSDWQPIYNVENQTLNRLLFSQFVLSF